MSRPGRNKPNTTSSTRLQTESLGTLGVGGFGSIGRSSSKPPEPRPDILIIEDEEKITHNTAASVNAWVKHSQEAPTPTTNSIDSLPSTTLESETALALYEAKKKQQLIDEEEMIAAKKKQETSMKSIRHMSVLFWIIIFANMSLIFPYGMIIWRVSKVGSGTYALLLTWDLLIPSVGVEVVLALMVFPYIAWVRMCDIKSANKKFSFHLMLGAHLTHFVVILICISIITKLRFAGTMRREFEKDFNKSISSRNRSSGAPIFVVDIFNRTQEQKICCGIDSYKDWDKLLPTGEYPITCCEDGSMKQKVCTKKEAKKRPGCLKIEQNALLCLCVTFIISVVLSAILSVLMVLQLIKIERYIRINSSGSDISVVSPSKTGSGHSKASKASTKSKKSNVEVDKPENERSQEQGDKP